MRTVVAQHAAQQGAGDAAAPVSLHHEQVLTPGGAVHHDAAHPTDHRVVEQRHVLALPGARMQVLGTNLPAAGGPVQAIGHLRREHALDQRRFGHARNAAQRVRHQRLGGVEPVVERLEGGAQRLVRGAGGVDGANHVAAAGAGAGGVVDDRGRQVAAHPLLRAVVATAPFGVAQHPQRRCAGVAGHRVRSGFVGVGAAADVGESAREHLHGSCQVRGARCRHVVTSRSARRPASACRCAASAPPTAPAAAARRRSIGAGNPARCGRWPGSTRWWRNPARYRCADRR